MTISFNPRQGLIIIPVELFGPSGSFVLRFALDTGASYTVVSVGMLRSIGYDPSAAKTKIPITTGSGQESAPLPNSPFTILNSSFQDRWRSLPERESQCIDRLTISFTIHQT